MSQLICFEILIEILSTHNISFVEKQEIIFSYALLSWGMYCIVMLLLSDQPKVTVTSCLAYKVIRNLESIDHLCINPICRIGLIHK